MIQDKLLKTAIIGGGAAGFFAASNISEALPNMEIHIFESSRRILEKVRISGGGRCNVTHKPMDVKELIKFYPRGNRELLGPFTRFSCQDTMNWFEERGVELKTESDGRIFPVSNSSETIINCLTSCLNKSNVQLHLTEKINEINANNENKFNLKTRDSLFEDFDYIIISTGSSPSGLELVKNMGLPITDLIPSLFTFHTKENWPKELMGLSVENVRIRIENHKIQSEGPLLFTHWGLSGPAVLKMSSFAAKELFELSYNTTVYINWLPNLSESDIIELIDEAIRQFPKKLSRNTSLFNLPIRLWVSLLTFNGIEEKVMIEFSKKDKNKLINSLMHTSLQMVGKSTFKEEFVTCGGIELNAINLKTFESKLHPNIHLVGELLNIDGLTGGFNFQAAWTGGWHAAQSIIEKVSKS